MDQVSVWDKTRVFIASLIPEPGRVRVRRYDSRRFWPLFVIFLFIVVTITHEAHYAGSFEEKGYEFIGFFYAVAINLSILVAEYFTRWQTTRAWAWRSFAIVAIGSGAMNVAYIKPWEKVGLEGVFAWIYAILPTVVIILLGFLSSNVVKLAGSQEARWQKAEEEKKVECFCGEKFSSERGLYAHWKFHANEVRGSEVDSLPSAIRFIKEKYPNEDADLYPSPKVISGWLGEKES